MKKVEIEENGELTFVASVPGKWAECDKDLVSKIIKIHACNKSTSQKRIEMLFLLCKADKDMKQYLLELSPQELHTLAYDKMWDWIWKSGVDSYFYKSFWYRGRKWVGPRKLLTNARLTELITAYQSFLMYNRTQKEDDLDRMIVALWRPRNRWDCIVKNLPNYNNDPRVKISQYRLEKYMKVAKGMDKEMKMALFLQFAGVWAKFQKVFKHFFPEQKGSNGEIDNRLWIKVVEELSKDGLFGTMEQTEMFSGTKVFLYMDHKIEQANELRRKQKQQSKR